MKSSAYITGFTFDGILGETTTWHVEVPGEPEPRSVHEAAVFGKVRCRVWGLLHGYGWLPVK